MSNDIREKVAEFAHSQWAGWMDYLFSKSTFNEDGTVTMPAWAVKRWLRQASTPYEDLPESEMESDRREADKFLAVIAQEPTLLVIKSSDLPDSILLLTNVLADEWDEAMNAHRPGKPLVIFGLDPSVETKAQFVKIERGKDDDS